MNWRRTDQIPRLRALCEYYLCLSCNCLYVGSYENKETVIIERKYKQRVDTEYFVRLKEQTVIRKRPCRVKPNK